MREPERPRGDHPDRVHDHHRDSIDVRVLAERLGHVCVQEQVRQAQRRQRQQPQRPVRALLIGRAPRVAGAVRNGRRIRVTQLLALRWRDIDWTAGRIRVMYGMRKKRRRKTKSRSSRRSVPMADRVAGELDQLFKASAYQSDEALVFGHPHTGRPLDRTSVTVRFQRVARRAGVRDDVVFHDLRHTYGMMMAARVPLRTLQGWMGHADIKTTAVYMHFAPAEDELLTANRVFPQREGDIKGNKLSETGINSTPRNPDEIRESG